MILDKVKNGNKFKVSDMGNKKVYMYILFSDFSLKMQVWHFHTNRKNV